MHRKATQEEEEEETKEEEEEEKEEEKEEEEEEEEDYIGIYIHKHPETISNCGAFGAAWTRSHKFGQSSFAFSMRNLLPITQL